MTRCLAMKDSLAKAGVVHKMDSLFACFACSPVFLLSLLQPGSFNFIFSFLFEHISLPLSVSVSLCSVLQLVTVLSPVRQSPSLSLSFCPSLCLPFSVCLYLFLCLPPLLSLSFCPSLCLLLSVCPSLSVSIFFSAYPPFSLSLSAPLSASFSLSALLCLSIFFSAYPPFSLSLSAPLSASFSLSALLCLSLSSLSVSVCLYQTQ